ncbi:MAG: class I SAM-dependent methyltransferase, partial [Treponema sp.]|nr:class I SAM-dependent methyltransferase [Treponema sp.]
MEIKLGDVQTTALIPVAIKASESLKPNARVKDEVAVQMIEALGINPEPYDKFLSHEGVIARTVMLD